MSQTLRLFIEARRAELESAEQPLLQQLADVQSRLAELQRERDEVEAAAAAIGMKVEARRIPGATIKEAVLDVLGEVPNGLNATEILRRINERQGTAYARTSLSPQLSRLKQEGKITLDGQVWRLEESYNFSKALQTILKESWTTVEHTPSESPNKSVFD